jgi:hypothetical protein
MEVRAVKAGERARQILRWRDEQAALHQEGVVAADDPTLLAIHRHHDALLAGFAADREVDLSREEERLSAGMRLATLLGAAALSIAWAMLASSLWNDLGPVAKLAMVWVPALALLPATGFAALREPSGYIANIVGTVGTIAMAVAGFATFDLYQVDSPRLPFLLFGAYGLFVAYRFRLVLPLLVGIVGVGALAWSLEALLLRSPVNDTFEHLEPLVLVGFAAYLVGTVRRSDPPAFSLAWRLMGVVAMVFPLLLLGITTDGSWLRSGENSELLYQLVGLIVFVAMVWLGLRRDDVILARAGATALVLFLFLRMVDWFWDAIPDWLFFLMMGGMAFGVLLVLRSVRERRRTT